MTRDIRPSKIQMKTKREAPRASRSFMRTRDRARSLRGMGGYFWMQVSAVSLVHSSRPVNTGSSTFLLSIRSIMTDGAL